jgi:hypothetical protein
MWPCHCNVEAQCGVVLRVSYRTVYGIIFPIVRGMCWCCVLELLCASVTMITDQSSLPDSCIAMISSGLRVSPDSVVVQRRANSLSNCHTLAFDAPRGGACVVVLHASILCSLKVCVQVTASGPAVWFLGPDHGDRQCQLPEEDLNIPEADIKPLSHGETLAKLFGAE